MPRPTQRINIFGSIGLDVTSEGVAQQLGAFDRSAPVLVEINSDGGSVQEGVAIHNLFRAWPGGVAVEIVGWALSVATVVAMAGGRGIRIHSTGLLMVHAPWLNVTGNAAELRGTADVLDQVASTMRVAYARTGKGKEVDKWLDGKDHWFTADEAKAAGLVDEVITGDVFAFANASGTRHPVPANILERIKTMPTPQAGANADTIRAEAVRAEVARRGAVRTAFAQFTSHEGMAAIQRQCEDDPECTVDLANQRILAQLGRGASSAAGGYTPSIGGNQSDFFEAARDALVMRAGMRVDKPHPAARDFRHMSVVTMAETLLSRMGRAPASRAPADIIKASMTTSDFPSLLADVANKSLRIGYNEAPATHAIWTGEKDVPDFKPTTLAMLSEGPDLLLKNEGGEYQYGALKDGASKFTLQTFGRIIRITREALINDDLSALSDVPRVHGAAARRLEADIVYGKLTANAALDDGIALFHASHGNLAGAGASISQASLGAARAAMRVQKGLAGKSYIDPQPRFLIVPVALETSSEALLATLTSATKGTDMAAAWVRGLSLVADPRLDAVSTAAWYLAADPKQIESIVRAYLATEARPFLEEFAEPKSDSTSFKARLDFCAGVVDHRGLYKNPGA